MPPRVDALTKDLRAIRTALRDLGESIERLALASARTPALGPSPPRRKLQLSPARRAALKLQGQYLGYMRRLGPRRKAKVRRIRATKGIRAAIAAAKRLGS
jgi:hypothetical protein